MVPSRRAVLLGSAALAAGCSGGGAEGRELRLATGPQGGPYEVLGERFAAELRRTGLKVRVLRTAASVANLGMLADGRADLGLALADSAEDAVAVRRLPITALARMYMNYVHLVVLRDSPVVAAAGLAGRTVAIGAQGSGTAVTAERVLDVAKLARPVRRVRMELDASFAALRRGEIAGFFWSGGVPTPALEAFARAAPVRLIPLDGLVATLRRAFGPVYEVASVPAGSYRLGLPVSTIGTASYLVCRADLSRDLAFTTTETLFSRRDRLQAPNAPGGRLDKRYAIGTGSVPLHPGAARYYRSVYG
ncbi:TAXI family TRAP transporter solute-binding subunit [Spirillospora sp. CA-294931]|uniref:TAXI family TRAP transporter solute-binding subunit n=1 Tax=Spirillospora sp. CA-294931 TaxID=3240042 RepID=UPI003D8BC3DF